MRRVCSTVKSTYYELLIRGIKKLLVLLFVATVTIRYKRQIQVSILFVLSDKVRLL